MEKEETLEQRLRIAENNARNAADEPCYWLKNYASLEQKPVENIYNLEANPNYQKPCADCDDYLAGPVGERLELLYYRKVYKLEEQE